MRRRAPGEALERLRRAHLASGLEPLRRRAARWGVDHEAALRGADPAVPPELHDRQADNWRPLLAIADRAGGAWPELARAAACRLSGAGAEPEQGAAGPLLADLRALFARTGAAPAGDDRDPAPPDRARGAAVGGLRRGPAAHPATAGHVARGVPDRAQANPAGRGHAQGVRPRRLRRRLPALRASRPDTATRGSAAAP